MKIQIKVTLLILAVAVLCASLGGAYYVYRGMKSDKFLEQELIATLKRKDVEKPDPGLIKFKQAMDMIQQGNTKDALRELYEMTRFYQDSQKFSEAKRVIGEINVDRILSPELTGGKTQEIVKRGDSLAAIANRNHCTLEYIISVNGMISTSLQPGDRLTVNQLKFIVVVDVTNKLVVLYEGEEEGTKRFIKEYPIITLKLPPNVKVPFPTELGDKMAYVGDKRVQVTDPLFFSSRKWLPTKKGGVLFRSPTVTTEGSDLGIILAEEDIEELFILLNAKTTVLVGEKLIKEEKKNST